MVMALVWLVGVSMALTACGVFERRARVVPRLDRPELAPPRARWGSGLEAPPVRAISARALAGWARLIRSRNVVSDQRPGLFLLGRIGACGSSAVGLAMIPFAGTWGGGMADPPLVLLDLRHGLAAIGLLLLVTSLSRVAVGLSERSAWSRLASVRQASRSIAALALVLLVVSPLAISSGTLRLHEIVLDQRGRMALPDWLLTSLDGSIFEWLDMLSVPSWNIFVQPLTALLFVPAMTLLIGNSRIDDPTTGAVGLAGVGIDADPIDRYWMTLDARLSTLLIAALFVTFFLGASSIPFIEVSGLSARLEPFVGNALPTLLVAGLQVASFLAKWLLVLAIVARGKRSAAGTREDRTLRMATRRLLPLAWANLLLVAAWTVWVRGFESGGAG